MPKTLSCGIPRHALMCKVSDDSFNETIDEGIYDRLNIPHNSIGQQILEAYAMLWHRYHPDFRGDHSFEEHLEGITRSFEELYDERARMAYDERIGLRKKVPYIREPEFLLDPLVIVGDAVDGDMIQYTLLLTPREVVEGVKKTIRVFRLVICTSCTCNACESCGFVITGLGRDREEEVWCPSCGGYGYKYSCEDCADKHRILAPKMLSVTIPPEYLENHLIIKEQGDARLRGGKRGDLKIWLINDIWD